MTRLIAAGGLIVFEAASHALYAGAWSGTEGQAGVWNVVVPALVCTGPAIYRTADECFRMLTECG